MFWRWRNAGIWQKIHDALCRWVRKIKGKKPTPSAGILDSQPADCTEVGGEERGYDAANNVKGRKRHIMVGLIMVIVIHAANIQDYDGAKLVFQALGERFKRLKGIFADSAYGKMGLPDWVAGLGQINVRLDFANGAATSRRERFCDFAQTLDRRAHLRLDRQVPPTLQRLRTKPRIKQSHDSHRNDEPDAQLPPISEF